MPSKKEYRRDCLQCGAPCVSFNLHVRFCSARCANRFKGQQWPMVVCSSCCVEFRSSRDRATFCSRACYADSLRQERHPAASTQFACIVPWGECLSCGSVMVAKNRKYCSRSCLADAMNAARASFFVYFFPCVMCGDLFTARSTTTKRCAACRAVHRREQRAKWRSTSHYDSVRLLLHVGPRDNWTCGICGKRVKRRHYDVTDKYSPTIDHIIPRSEGGTHDLANLRLAHMICNSLRQHHGGGEQLCLVG